MTIKATEALHFLASVIKSGESWTEYCERSYREALADLARVDRKLFLKNGWARLALQEHIFKQQQEFLTKIRDGGRFGILVSDDPIALEFQRLQFKRYRISYALGLFGPRAHYSWKYGKFFRDKAEDLHAGARRLIDISRARAYKAVHDAAHQQWIKDRDEAVAAQEEQDWYEELNRGYNSDRL